MIGEVLDLEKLFQTDVYKEVMELANSKGYSMNIFSFSKNDDYAKMGNGIHYFDEENKRIDIGILEDYGDNIGIYIHELLHAKLALNGYPKVKTYGSLGEHVDEIVLEIENIAHHTFIYPEMNRLGYEHDDLNNTFVSEVIEDTNKETVGGSEIIRSLRLLEGYYRIPNRINEIAEDVSKKQPKAFNLYSSFRKYLESTTTPYDMRKSVVQILKHINNYAKRELRTDLLLNYTTRLEPILTKNELKQKANSVFKAVKLNNVEHIFLIKRKDDYCCYFLGLSMVDINRDLKTLTTNELMNKYGLAYMKES